ncbi:MAG: ATP-dependent Clp protease adapter ClpS [Pseudomonadota bacterium]|nr:ATP-dependent Clp protease adapter ClpS [Pseudomonadota bacterium]
MDSDHTDERPDKRDEAELLVRTRTRKPSMYKVLLLNDNYTPMDFVVHVLQDFFGKSLEDAVEIMLTVHHIGVGVAGIYTFEIAETKSSSVMEHARHNKHPLQCAIEKE